MRNKPKAFAALAVVTLAALLLSACAKPQTTWITDLPLAVGEAKKSKKDLLIVFTGSDWSDSCKTMNKNVFTPAFFQKASKNFVLCNIDIVQDKSLMDEGQLEKNYALAAEYGAQALPYFILQTAAEDIYASSPETEQTVTTENFLSFLQSFEGDKKNLIALKKKILSAKGIERAKHIDAFIESILPSRREHYAGFIREVPLLDSDGKAGLKGKYQIQVAYLDSNSLYREGKLIEAGNVFIALAESDSLEKAQLQDAWYMGAYMYAMAGNQDNERILEWLEKAVAADPTNPGAAKIAATITQMKSALKPAR